VPSRDLDQRLGSVHPVLEIAREVDASLIVLDLYRRSLLAKRTFASTVRSVVLAAPCPVLVVPDVHPSHEPPPLPSMGQR
jgi:nucleotide-binding universal stress UspA family protein